MEESQSNKMTAYGGLKWIYFSKIKRDRRAAEGRLACHPLRIFLVEGVVWPACEPGFPGGCSALSVSPVGANWASQEGTATILSPPFPAAELHSLLHRAVHLHVRFLSAQSLSVCLPAPASWLSCVTWKRRKTAFNAEIGYGILFSFFFFGLRIITWRGSYMPKAAVGLTPLLCSVLAWPCWVGSAAGAEGPAVTLGLGKPWAHLQGQGAARRSSLKETCGTCAGIYLHIPFQSS